MIQTHIQIVSSTRRELSSMGAESREAARTVLARHYSQVGVTLVDSAADAEALVRLRPDLVFLGMKYLPGVRTSASSDEPGIWLNNFLEDGGIACTGSGSVAHQYELNKDQAKHRVSTAGLATAPFCVSAGGIVRDGEVDRLKFPRFVKPTDRGGGMGIDDASVVYTNDQMLAKVSAIYTTYHADSLIEEYLPGREFSVAILRDEYGTGYSAMPIELVARPNVCGASMLSASIKSANAETVLAVPECRLRDDVCALAYNVFNALGARDYGRIDIRLDSAGKPHFLEANLIPSLISGYGSFPKACLLNSGRDYESMILSITRLGLLRSQSQITTVVALPSLEIA